MGVKKHVTESEAVENLAALRRMMTDDTAMDEIILLLLPFFKKKLRVRGQKDTGLRFVFSPCFLSISVSLALRGVRSYAASLLRRLHPLSLSLSLSSAFLLRRPRWVVVVVGGGNCFINFLTLLFFHCVVRKIFLLSSYHRYPSLAKPVLLNNFLRAISLV